MAGVNKMIELYYSGMSIPEINTSIGVPLSTIRNKLVAEGVVLRTRAEGVRNAGIRGKLGSGLRGKVRIFSEDHKIKISKSKLKYFDKVGRKLLTLKKNGYLVFTAGTHVGKSLHTVIMEKYLKRSLESSENVHHIDWNKLNNKLSNLELMLRCEHMRMHRLSEPKKIRTRDGRFLSYKENY